MGFKAWMAALAAGSLGTGALVAAPAMMQIDLASAQTAHVRRP